MENVVKLISWVNPLSIVLRPRLVLTSGKPRCREAVAALYDPPCPALYLRVWVYNFGLSPALNCSVFVNRVLRDGQILDDERSPLNWTDIDTFQPQILPTREHRGRYADVCAASERMPSLQIKSQKGTRGYGIYTEAGVYSLEISAETPNRLTSIGRIRMDVNYEGRWNGLSLIAVTALGKHRRWW